MADLFSMMNRAVRALDAQRYGLDVAGQNINNVNTPGYVRRTAELAESFPSDPFGPGGGVDVVAVTSARAPLVQARLRYEEPSAAREQAVAEHLGVVESYLGQPGTSLDESLSRFYNTYASLAQNPTSSAARQQVIVEGQALTRAFDAIDGQLRSEQVITDREIRSNVAQVNALASQLADINRQISQTEPQNSAGLIDQQAVVITELGKLVDVHIVERNDGSTDVQVGNGRALVLGDRAYELQAITDPNTGFASITATGAAVPTDVTT